MKLWVRFQLCRPRCSLSIWGCARGLVLWESTVRSEIVLMLPFCKFTDRRRVISELVECTKLLLNTIVDDHPSLTAPSLKSPFLPPGWLQTILFFSHEDRSWLVSTLTHPHWAWKYIAYPALSPQPRLWRQQVIGITNPDRTQGTGTDHEGRDNTSQAPVRHRSEEPPELCTKLLSLLLMLLSSLDSHRVVIAQSVQGGA